jgi:hypothetical protein
VVEGGAFPSDPAESYSDHEFCIGEPYLYQPTMAFYEQIVRILFYFADPNGDECLTQDEFFAIVGQARSGMPAFQGYLTQFFNYCDETAVDETAASGVLTYHELNTCIAESPDQFGGEELIEMAQILF